MCLRCVPVVDEEGLVGRRSVTVLDVWDPGSPLVFRSPRHVEPLAEGGDSFYAQITGGPASPDSPTTCRWC